MFHEVFQMVYQLIHEYRLNKTWQGMGFYATIRWRQGYPMLHGDEKLGSMKNRVGSRILAFHTKNRSY